jgi:hypothetical protein
MRDSESWGKKDRIRIVRFCVDLSMCMMALSGLTGIAVDIVCFRLGIEVSFSGETVTTNTQRFALVGSHGAWSALGFLYMLWRHNWHCRLSTLLKIMAYCCVLFAAGSALSRAGIMIAMASVGVFNFVYAFIWSCRINGREELKNAKKARDGSQAL